MSGSDFKHIDENVGFWSAVALVAGTSVGMTIFVVPTQMAALAGPSIVLAILASIIPMVFAILMLLQLGGAIPVAGGVYVYASRLVGPYWGMIAVSVPALAVWSYLLFAGIGFSQYFNGVLEPLVGVTLPATAVIWGLVGSFFVLNYVGIRMVAKVQIALVLFLLGGLFLFMVGMAPSVDAANYTPLFPDELFADSMAPFFLAIVVLYLPFQGFSIIIELGEEIENPVRNIPRVLAVGMTGVTIVTVTLIVVLVGAVPWQETIDPETGEAVEGGLLTVSEGILPEGAIFVIGLAAMVAGATTVNTVITSYSRTVMRASRDEILPGTLASIHDRFGTPDRALILICVPPLVVAPFTDPLGALLAIELLDWLAVIITVGFFLAFLFGGIALWNLPRVFPTRYEYSVYKLPMPLLRVTAVVNVILSILFGAFIAIGAPSALGFVGLWLIVVTAAYLYRVRAHEKRGEDLRARMALLHKHEQVGDDD